MEASRLSSPESKQAVIYTEKLTASIRLFSQAGTIYASHPGFFQPFVQDSAFFLLWLGSGGTLELRDSSRASSSWDGQLPWLYALVTRITWVEGMPKHNLIDGTDAVFSSICQCGSSTGSNCPFSRYHLTFIFTAWQKPSPTQTAVIPTWLEVSCRTQVMLLALTCHYCSL